MAEEVDPLVIKKTQDILGSVIKKPALTEKSLKRPPFRFLHDIITNVIKTSGFLKGLYSPQELQSENVKDKESKIAFLQKTVDVLSSVTNQPINLKPSKVVAGHDPQKTNIFLQILGTAAKNKLDSTEAVEKVLSGQNQGSPVKAMKERRASVDKRSKGSSEKAHSRSLTKTIDPGKKTSSQNKESSKVKDSEKSKEKSKDPKKDRERSKDRGKHKSEESKKSSREKNIKPKETQPVEEASLNLSEQEIINIENNEEIHDQIELDNEVDITSNLVNGDVHNKEPIELENEVSPEKPVREKSHRPHSSRSARPPSARNKRTKPLNENDSAVEIDVPASVVPRQPMKATSSEIMGNVPLASEQDTENTLIPRPPSARPPSARPSSSRPAPPRIRIRNIVDNEEPSIRPATAKPVENVILDQAHESEEEEETFIVVDESEVSDTAVQNTDSLPAETPDEDKGSLVKKLLETKKDLEGGSQNSLSKKVEIDKSQMTEVARNRERDSASKELGQLRNFVQSLSKTAVPLGRMLDFLQEDLDAMKMELKMWKEEHAQNLIALYKEQSATESLLEPLRAQLDDLDQVVQNQLDANSALKSSIARNDERIQRMLSSVKHKS